MTRSRSPTGRGRTPPGQLCKKLVSLRGSGEEEGSSGGKGYLGPSWGGRREQKQKKQPKSHARSDMNLRTLVVLKVPFPKGYKWGGGRTVRGPSMVNVKSKRRGGPHVNIFPERRTKVATGSWKEFRYQKTKELLSKKGGHRPSGILGQEEFRHLSRRAVQSKKDGVERGCAGLR